MNTKIIAEKGSNRCYGLIDNFLVYWLKQHLIDFDIIDFTSVETKGLNFNNDIIRFNVYFTNKKKYFLIISSIPEELTTLEAYKLIEKEYEKI